VIVKSENRAGLWICDALHAYSGGIQDEIISCHYKIWNLLGCC